MDICLNGKKFKVKCQQWRMLFCPWEGDLQNTSNFLRCSRGGNVYNVTSLKWDMRAFRSISWWLYRRSTKLWCPSLVNSQRRPHGRSSVNGRGNNWKEIVWDGYTGFMISKSWRRNKRNNDNRNERKLPNPPIQLKPKSTVCNATV